MEHYVPKTIGIIVILHLQQSRYTSLKIIVTMSVINTYRITKTMIVRNVKVHCSVPQADRFLGHGVYFSTRCFFIPFIDMEEPSGGSSEVGWSEYRFERVAEVLFLFLSFFFFFLLIVLYG